MTDENAKQIADLQGQMIGTQVVTMFIFEFLKQEHGDEIKSKLLAVARNFEASNRNELKSEVLLAAMKHIQSVAG